MYGPEGNSQFCFPESPDVSRDEVKGNIRTRGKTKLTSFLRDHTLNVLLYMFRLSYSKNKETIKDDVRATSVQLYPGRQGSYRSWKTWKVMAFYNFIFQAWKVLKFRCGSRKVMENQYDFYE